MKMFYCNGKKDFCFEQKCYEPNQNGYCKFCDGTGGEEREVENPYWDRICAMSDRQRAKGLATYGQGLEANPADILKRLEHLQEELIDGLMCCEWIKEKILEIAPDIGKDVTE